MELHNRYHMLSFLKKALALKPTEFTTLPIQQNPIPSANSRFVDVILILDASQSMRDNDKHNMRKGAAVNFIRALLPEDRVGIIEFANQAVSLINLTTNKEAAISAISRSVAKNEGTHIDKAIRLGITEMIKQAEHNHQAIILFTDGSGKYQEDLTRQARQAHIKIFTVGLGSKINTYLLQSIALKTGGKYLHAMQAHELLEVFQRLGKTLRLMAENHGRLLLK